MSTVNKKINFGKIRKVILFGGDIIMRYTILKLKAAGFEIAVFSGKRNLNQKIDSCSLEDFLLKEKINFVETSDINSNKVIQGMVKSDTLGISFSAPWIFKKNFIDLFSGRLLNYHQRNLPKDRGGGGFSWMILKGDKKSACLIHQIDKDIDAGAIVKSEKFLFPSSCEIPNDYEEYSFKKDKIFFDIFIHEIKNEKTFSLTVQDENVSTYFPRLHSLTQGLIDWRWAREEIVRFIKAFDDPYCGASTYLNNEKIFIKKCAPSKDKEKFHIFMSGLIYRKDNKAVFVATKDGGIKISQITNSEGESIMDIIKPGRRFFTPINCLEEAIKFYPIYTSEGLKIIMKRKHH